MGREVGGQRERLWERSVNQMLWKLSMKSWSQNGSAGIKKCGVAFPFASVMSPTVLAQGLKGVHGHLNRKLYTKKQLLSAEPKRLLYRNIP